MNKVKLKNLNIKLHTMKTSIVSSRRKTVKLSLFIASFAVIILLLVSCKPDLPTVVPTLPAVSTADVTSITQNSVTLGGNVSSEGNALVSERGLCWGLSSNPTISDNKITNGVGLGSFTGTINGLTAGTTYHARAYARNSVGVGYGLDVSFVTTAIMYPVTLLSGANGTATSPKEVALGTSFEVIGTPNVGFMTDSINVNGVKFNLNGANSYTVMSNLKPPIVSVTFKMDVLWTLLEKPWVEVLLQTRLHTGGTTWTNSTTGYKVEKYDFRPDGMVRIYYNGQEGYPQFYKLYGDSLDIGTGDEGNKNKIITITRDSLVIRTIVKAYIMPGFIPNPSYDADYQRTFKH